MSHLVRRILTLALSLAVAVPVLVGPSASGAPAMSTSSAGRTGYVYTPRVIGSHWASCYYSYGYRLCNQHPSLVFRASTVYRPRGTTAALSVQRTIAVQRWNGGWYNHTNLHGSAYIPRGYRSARIAEDWVVPSAANFMRVRMLVVWRNARTNAVVGYKRIDLFGNDYTCQTIYRGCWTYNGYIQVRAPGV